MATPRRVKNSPKQSTLLPRRNSSKPGMGGQNRPGTSGNPGLWGGNQQAPGNVAQALTGLGFDAPDGGFGFDQGQQSSLMAELARIQQAMAGREMAPQFDYNPNRGIAGNLGAYERQLGIDPHHIDPLGASQGQRQGFASAVGYQGQLPPMQHPMQGPPQGPPQQHGGWDAGHGGWQGPNAGQPQMGPQQQVPNYPQHPPQWYSPGHMGGGMGQQQPQIPWYGQFGHDAPPGPAGAGQYQPPQSFSPGNPGFQNPLMQQQSQMQGQAPPQAAMPPFPGASPTAGAEAAQASQGFGFQPLQLPGFSNFVQPYYGELPTQPSYLTGQGQVQQQAYMNALRNQLAGLQSQYGQVAPEYNLAGTRLGTNYGVDRERLAGNLGSHGVYGSGYADTQFNRQETDYNRQFQDLRSQAQNALGGIYSQAGSAFDQTQQALLDLYAQQARQQAANPSAPYQAHRKPTPKRKKK